jgi:NADH:ubiquinone oxidoreductase subunit F (NADH-binding)
LQALLIGGYFGTWVEYTAAAQLRLARTDLHSIGATLGSGVVIALGQSTCGLRESAEVVGYLAGESAGQCGPCVHGLAAIAQAFGAVANGVATEHERRTLERWLLEVRGRGACHHPDGVSRFAQSALEVFAAEIELHRHGRCGKGTSARVRRALDAPSDGRW